MALDSGAGRNDVPGTRLCLNIFEHRFIREGMISCPGNATVNEVSAQREATVLKGMGRHGPAMIREPGNLPGEE